MVKQRNDTIDLIKFICAFGVISIHVKSNTSSALLISNVFWPFCVPFFFIISLVYFIKGLGYKTINIIFLNIWHRILIPLLSWTVVYGGLILVKLLLTGNYKSFNIWKAIFYGQTGVQMYYLPMLLLLQAYAIALHKILNFKSKEFAIGILILFITVTYHILGYLNNCFTLGTFIALPTYIFASFYISAIVVGSVRKNIYLLVGIIVSVCAVVIKISDYDGQFLGYPFLLLLGGVGLSTIAVTLRNINLPPYLSKLLSTSYGIYLSHVLFLELLEFIIEKYYRINIYYDFITRLSVTFVIFIMSIMFTQIVRKIPVFNYFLLGVK